jgi:hypothetical protein
MKKYMKNFAIRLTEDNRTEVKAWFDKNIPMHNFEFDAYDSYYGIFNNEHFCRITNPTSIIDINRMSELEEKEKEFPKYMMVSDHPNSMPLEKRLVIARINACYIAVALGDESNYNNNKYFEAVSWKCATEIDEHKILELTIDEIAEKYNVNPEQIKIKK